MPGTESTASDRPFSPSDLHCAYLFRVLHAEAPLEPSSRHALQSTHRVFIGRGPRDAVRRSSREGGELHLTFPDSKISSSHARLTRSGGAETWTIEDCGSRNGLLVNGARAKSARLGDGDLVEVGHTFLVFRASLPTDSEAPLDATEVELPAPAAGMETLSPPRPLNIRELAKALETALVLAPGNVTDEATLLRVVRATPVATAGASPTREEREDEVSESSGSARPLSPEDLAIRAKLVHLVEAHQGSISAIARAMGKARVQIRRWIKRFQIAAPVNRSEPVDRSKPAGRSEE